MSTPSTSPFQPAEFPVVRFMDCVLRASTLREETDTPMTCAVSVSKDDPCAVQMVFRVGDVLHTPWLFDRDVLAQCLTTGTSSPDAQADVFLWLEGDLLVAALSSPGGECCVAFPAVAMFEFRAAADAAIPALIPDGAIDSALTAILTDADKEAGR